MIAFWREIFDAKISDYIEDRISGVDLHFTFLRVNPRHHSIAVAATKGIAMDPFATKIQHLEMQAATLDDIGAAYRRCRALGFKIAMAVGQHPNDRDVSFYAVTPSGFYFELGWVSEGDRKRRPGRRRPTKASASGATNLKTRRSATSSRRSATA